MGIQYASLLRYLEHHKVDTNIYQVIVQKLDLDYCRYDFINSLRPSDAYMHQ